MFSRRFICIVIVVIVILFVVLLIATLPTWGRVVVAVTVGLTAVGLFVVVLLLYFTIFDGKGNAGHGCAAIGEVVRIIAVVPIKLVCSVSDARRLDDHMSPRSGE